MQKQLKKGELKRKKYKQEFNKSKRNVKVSITFNKVAIKRFKGKKFRRKSIYLKRALKYFPSGRLLKYSKFFKSRSKNFLDFNIKVSPNNIFCNLSENKYGKVHSIKSLSTGGIKLKTTKKRLKFNLKPFLSTFLRPIMKEKAVKFAKALHIKVTAPHKLKSKILEMMRSGLLKRLISQKNVVLDLPDNKIFNGCRPKKDLRQKNRISLYEN